MSCSDELSTYKNPMVIGDKASQFSFVLTKKHNVTTGGTYMHKVGNLVATYTFGRSENKVSLKHFIVLQ